MNKKKVILVYKENRWIEIAIDYVRKGDLVALYESGGYVVNKVTSDPYNGHGGQMWFDIEEFNWIKDGGN